MRLSTLLLGTSGGGSGYRPLVPGVETVDFRQPSVLGDGGGPRSRLNGETASHENSEVRLMVRGG